MAEEKFFFKPDQRYQLIKLPKKIQDSVISKIPPPEGCKMETLFVIWKSVPNVDGEVAYMMQLLSNA
jgi:hypothetical protein